MKLEQSFEIAFESLNFLEERVSENIWELLFQNFDKLPKQAKVNIKLEFESIS